MTLLLLTAKMGCFLLALAAAQYWSLHQFDVHNAFFHGDLSEKICVPSSRFSVSGRESCVSPQQVLIIWIKTSFS